MKQRIVVQALIENNGRFLLLKRSQGRPESIGTYELPGGTIGDSEQPDDAIRRHIRTSIGVDVAIVSLRDVVSMNNREEGEVRHVFIVYTVTSITSSDLLHLGQSYDDFVWLLPLSETAVTLRDSAAELLNLYISTPIRGPLKQKLLPTAYTLYSDGGSRGNPGPSAAAFVLYDPSGAIVERNGEYLGITTNNQAEYHGIMLGLESARDHGVTELECHVDSMLVVNQLNGSYKIKNRELWPIHERITLLLSGFKSVRVMHVRRERNQAADQQVNKILDDHKNLAR